MKKFFWGCLLLYVIYGIIISSYLLLINPSIPEQVIGTQADPTMFMTEEQWTKANEFSKVRNSIFFLQTPLEWLIYLFLICYGVSVYFHRWSKKIVKLRLVYTSIYIVLLSSFCWLVSLPIKFSSFQVSQYYGISIQPFQSWMRENMISFWIEVVFLTIIALVIMYLLKRSPRRWWLYTWLLSIPFTLFLMYIQPVVIDPLYHDFSPIQDKQLEEEILGLAQQSDIPAERVYEVKLSTKTNALNAYVTGVGSNLRIVLWDTTLEKLTKEEVLFVMAHEMAHYDLNHLPLMLVASILFSFFGLYFTHKLYGMVITRFGKKLNVKKDDLGALPIILLIISLLSFAANPISNYMSRTFEYQSDRYALQLTNDPDAAIRTFQKLSIESLSEVNPPKLVKIIRYTHPPMVERITKIKEMAEERN